MFFSNSGNTKECVFAANVLRDRGIHILAVIYTLPIRESTSW